jgi:hypothetical protein
MSKQDYNRLKVSYKARFGREAMKKCPYCAEKVKDDALVCKHCGRSLVQSSGDGGSEQQMPSPVIQVVQQKKSRTGCWIGIAVLVAILIIFVVFLKACADVTTPKSPTLVDPVASTVEALNGQKSEVTPGAPEKTVFHIGDSVAIGDLQLTVNGVKEVAGNEFNKPKDGFRFIVINSTFENKGTTDSFVSSSSFKVLGGDGVQYESSIMALIASEGESKFDSLLPGAKVTGSTGFELPVGQSSFKLVYKPISFTNENVIFELSLP